MQDGEYYLARARHAREMADKAAEEPIRKTHLQMAASYEAMARLRVKMSGPPL
ncbi:hypothetical protein [Sphingomonas sp.]|jgi:hypothetical protein|uniref:hypothetical protein n=1 Tax=Sphingomonas sp. TaxID=28214 RepID=UPI002E0FCE35|nr:hypothetical protein [Sphingomonas sp.]